MTADLTFYANRISELEEDFISNLAKPEDMSGNTTMFAGLIKFIRRNLFNVCHLDYDDIATVDGVWDCYTALCYKYNKYPTVIEFSTFIGISKDTIDRWKNNKSRGYIYYDKDNNIIKDINIYLMTHDAADLRKVPSTIYSDAVKKWLAECESNLYRGATETGRIGCIFALKANYGYVETAPRQVEPARIEAEPTDALPQLGGASAPELCAIVAQLDAESDTQFRHNLDS